MTSFGQYLWNEVGVILFHRIMTEAQAGCLRLAQTLETVDRTLQEMTYHLTVVWEVGRTYLTPQESQQHDGRIRAFIQQLTSTCEAVLPPTVDKVTACRSLQRVLEEQGFPEPENGGLACAMADVRQANEPNSYSYSERTSLVMPCLPRYDGDKRLEEEHSRQRTGHLVELPHPHPHPEVNTAVQLIEPKKRRTQLDEYRIFSHPKKATTYGVEDFMVDEELLNRSLAVLTRHLDSCGSLQGLSPFARFLLWNVVARDDEAFNLLSNATAATEPDRQRLEDFRRVIAARKAAFKEVRPLAREAAQRIGWYAVSAQWRDQVLHKLSDMEDLDWYGLSDAQRMGGSAIFPNYARAEAVASLAVGIVTKMDAVLTEGDIPPVAEVVKALLLPLLRGDCPELTPFCFASGLITEDSDHWQAVLKKLSASLSRKPTEHDDAVSAAPSTSMLYALVCSSLVFPLQCLAELLELCALSFHSPAGLEEFSRCLLQAEWTDEEGILRFLLRMEPMNPSIAPMAALPRLYKDLVTGVQLLARDRMLSLIVAARRLAGESGVMDLHRVEYWYWRTLVNAFQDEDRHDDFIFLKVDTASQPLSFEGRWYTEGAIEVAPKVWPEDLVDFYAREHAYKVEHPLVIRKGNDTVSA